MKKSHQRILFFVLLIVLYVFKSAWNSSSDSYSYDYRQQQTYPTHPQYNNGFQGRQGNPGYSNHRTGVSITPNAQNPVISVDNHVLPLPPY